MALFEITDKPYIEGAYQGIRYRCTRCHSLKAASPTRNPLRKDFRSCKKCKAITDQELWYLDDGLHAHFYDTPLPATTKEAPPATPDTPEKKKRTRRTREAV